MTHPQEQLPEACAGQLGEATAARIAEHLRSCESCAADAASWQAVADGVHHRFSQVPAPLLGQALAGILAGARVPADLAGAGGSWAAGVPVPAYVAAGTPHPWRRLVSLLLRQRRLVPGPTWPVSALVLVLGAVVAATVSGQVARDVLATVVPLVTTIAVATACGVGTDPVAELTTATGIPRQVILLARLALVLGWVFALAAALSLGLAVTGTPGGAVVLTAAWTGPAAALAAAGFALAVRWRAEAGVWLAVAAWTLRMLGTGDVLHPVIGRAVMAVWEAQTGVLLTAGAVVVALALVVPAGDRGNPVPATS